MMGWVSGGSPVHQPTIGLRHASTTHLHTILTCLCEIDEMYNDTSWAEVFHDTSWAELFHGTSWAELFHGTSWAELFHGTSWFVNFSDNFLGNAENHGDPDYKADDVSSTKRLFGRIIKFVLATTASSGRPQFTRQQQSIRNWIEYLINTIFTGF